MLRFVHVHVDYTYRIDLYMYMYVCKGFSLIGGGRVGLFKHLHLLECIDGGGGYSIENSNSLECIGFLFLAI